MEVAELREILQVSQEELAKKLKVTQAAISRRERRPNLLLESITNYIEALGGRLELHAVLPRRTVSPSAASRSIYVQATLCLIRVAATAPLRHVTTRVC